MIDYIINNMDYDMALGIVCLIVGVICFILHSIVIPIIKKPHKTKYIKDSDIGRKYKYVIKQKNKLYLLTEKQYEEYQMKGHL